MNLGIVGSEAKKFTKETEDAARFQIRELIADYRPKYIVSGGCHLGGIDIWAVEEATKAGIKTLEFVPKTLQWNPKSGHGYKQRNEEIAQNSDVVACITVQSYPPGYDGMRFDYCYHCGTDSHIKSGGCWTVKCAKRIGKEGIVIVL